MKNLFSFCIIGKKNYVTERHYNQHFTFNSLLPVDVDFCVNYIFFLLF
jgi:hypothetical protein